MPNCPRPSEHGLELSELGLRRKRRSKERGLGLQPHADGELSVDSEPHAKYSSNGANALLKTKRKPSPAGAGLF